MRDFRDAKAMAQTLRDALKARSVSLTHSESLELIAKILGFHDWNVLSARIQSEHRPPATGHPVAMPLPAPGSAGLPTVPLRDIVLFPRTIVPLFVGRDSTRRAVERAMAGDKRVLALTQRRAADDNPAPHGLYGVGVMANIIHLKSLADGTIQLLVEGFERATVSHLAEGQYLAAEVVPFEETRGHSTEAIAMMDPVLETFRTCRNGSLAPEPIHARLRHLQHIREPGALADAIAPLLHAEIAQKQDLLETDDVVRRLEKIIALMNTERRPAQG
jgi:ATP-dependent Lon protease